MGLPVQSRLRDRRKAGLRTRLRRPFGFQVTQQFTALHVADEAGRVHG